MANSKLLPANNGCLRASLEHFLAPLIGAKSPEPTTLLVAFSGGLDSSVLLHLLIALQSRLTFTLKVMHVHHGISAHADAWADFCQQTCAGYGAACEVKRVKLDNRNGLGLEATARQARYAQLASMQADFIVLAHHQQDQAETVLLQLARGAGVKGLAAMPAVDETRRLLRPLLDVCREALLQYARTHHLQWLEDESNDDTHYARNFMRHAVLPVLAQRYPAIHTTLSRTASHMAEAQRLLDALAVEDAKHALQRDPYAQFSCLNLLVLRQLMVARANNVLRFWLAQHGLQMPSTEHLTQLRQQLLKASAGADVHVRVSPNMQVRCYRDLAYLVADEPSTLPFETPWQGEPVVMLTHGQLTFETTVGRGLCYQKLAEHAVCIGPRRGGETLKPAHQRPTRSLKYLLHAAHIPPWLRADWPLLKIGQQMVCVPNVADDVNWLAGPQARGCLIRWHPNATLRQADGPLFVE